MFLLSVHSLPFRRPLAAITPVRVSDSQGHRAPALVGAHSQTLLEGGKRGSVPGRVPELGTPAAPCKPALPAEDLEPPSPQTYRLFPSSPAAPRSLEDARRSGSPARAARVPRSTQVPAGKQWPHLGETRLQPGSRGHPAPAVRDSPAPPPAPAAARRAPRHRGPAGPGRPSYPTPAARAASRRGERAAPSRGAPGALGRGMAPARRLQVGTEDREGRRAAASPRRFRRPRGVITAAPGGAGGGGAAAAAGAVAEHQPAPWESGGRRRERRGGGEDRRGEGRREQEESAGAAVGSRRKRAGGETEGGGKRRRKAGGGVRPTGGGLGRIPAAVRWPRGSECERQKDPPGAGEPAVALHCAGSCQTRTPRARHLPPAERAGWRLGPTGLSLMLHVGD